MKGTTEQMKKLESMSQNTIALQKVELQLLEMKCSETLAVAIALRSELFDMEKMLSASAKENAELKEEDGQNKCLNSQLRTALGEAKQLLTSFEKQNIGFKKLCTELQIKNLELTREIQSQTGKLKALADQNAKIEEKEQTSASRADQLKYELEDLVQLYDSLKDHQDRKLVECESKICQMKEVLSHYKEEVSTLQLEHKQVINMKEEIISDLKNEMDTLENMHEESKTFSAFSVLTLIVKQL